MGTVTANHFSRNQESDFRRPASAGGGTSREGGGGYAGPFNVYREIRVSGPTGPAPKKSFMVPVFESSIGHES